MTKNLPFFETIVDKVKVIVRYDENGNYCLLGENGDSVKTKYVSHNYSHQIEREIKADKIKRKTSTKDNFLIQELWAIQQMLDKCTNELDHLENVNAISTISHVKVRVSMLLLREDEKC